MKSLYLLVDFFTILIPFLFSFHPKLQFYKEWKSFFKANALVALIFILWDLLYTHLGVWGFNSNYVLGYYLYNLPIEEILFFICIPYSCVFTYFCLGKFYPLKWKTKTENTFVYFLVVFLLVFGFIYIDQLYTSAVFFTLSFLLIYIKYKLKVEWLGKLISVYCILLIPFLIVNGILTGTGIDSPVVWYNSNHFIGLRILTIPFEDIFYGFEMILLNVYFFEKFREQKMLKAIQSTKYYTSSISIAP